MVLTTAPWEMPCQHRGQSTMGSSRAGGSILELQQPVCWPRSWHTVGCSPANWASLKPIPLPCCHSHTPEQEHRALQQPGLALLQSQWNNQTSTKSSYPQVRPALMLSEQAAQSSDTSITKSLLFLHIDYSCQVRAARSSFREGYKQTVQTLINSVHTGDAPYHVCASSKVVSQSPRA